MKRFFCLVLLSLVLSTLADPVPEPEAAGFERGGFGGFERGGFGRERGFERGFERGGFGRERGFERGYGK
jgi:hypothetical protein